MVGDASSPDWDMKEDAQSILAKRLCEQIKLDEFRKAQIAWLHNELAIAREEAEFHKRLSLRW